MRVLLTLGFFLLSALPAQATVRINEIAWMGNSDNPNAEWIELYNDSGDTVTLGGYALTSSTGAPTIALTGSITPGGFYLLTRTSTSIIPGVTGDQSYTGALSNTGATLTLSQGSVVVDTVEGGSNWQNVGGSNTTKETAQRVSSGWVTAPGTPKATNATADVEEDEEEEVEEPEEEVATTTPAVTIGGSSTNSGVGSFSFPRLYLQTGGSRVVVAQADTPYTAFVFDEDGRSRSAAKVVWTFGDGMRRVGQTVHHAYEAPGEYLVVARATHKDISAIRTFTVRAESADVSIGSVSEESIEIVNGRSELLDLSRWQLLVEGKRFTIPDDTAILPKGKSLFSTRVTKLVGSSAALLFPDGREAAQFGTDSLEDSL